MTTTSHAPARATDLESRALSMLTDDQVVQSFIRSVGVRHGAAVLPSLHDRLGVEDYVALIFARCPA
ncbi:hypothetical protein ABH944_004838 [Caballeronia udeis]|uniref:Uncharacterized protein n=1 Tax=Caballeronia udeis TaxID=1232866 RepID=A0ABW8MLV3_9BURK